MARERILPVLALLALLCNCSGEREAPGAASPQRDAASVATPAAGGPPAAEGPGREQGAEGRNSLPEVRGVRFVGGGAGPGNGIGVEAEGYDADGDAVQFEIGWQRNGQPAGSGNRLTVPLKRGDKVVVTITPFDGRERGRAAVFTREIANTPPAIEGQEQFRFEENVATFHVRASDPDGDPLTYSLKDPPAGMSIDRGTGKIRWAAAPGTTGRVPFTVLVADGAGGEATARFTVTVAEQPPEAK